MLGRLLIVEDHQEESVPFRELLLFKGYDVIVCENGLDALAIAVEQKPDLIIVDLLLALRGDDLDGYEVIKRLRTVPTTRRIGILAWTSHFVKDKDQIRALRSGADDFVTKDVETGVLEARIEALLRRVRWMHET